MKHTGVRYHPQQKFPTALLENFCKCHHLYLLVNIHIASASRDYFVETDNGYYSVNTINGAL